MEMKELEKRMNRASIKLQKHTRELKRSASRIGEATQEIEACILEMQEISGEDMQSHIDQMHGAKLLVEVIKGI